MHEALRLAVDELRPLRDPVLIAAFAGFTDPTGAAVATVRHLEEQWSATPLASIDPERFFDFTVQRPVVRMVEGERVLEWPENRIAVARPPGVDRDFLLLIGVEPHMRWRTFLAAIEEVLRATGSTMSVTLGAQASAVPHTRPLPVTLSSSATEFEAMFGMQAPASRYQGPTGIAGVLNLRTRALGWKNASLWAMLPHYLNAGPNPNAAIALAGLIDRAFGTHTPLGALEERARVYAEQVRETLAAAPDGAAYVRQLEEQYDALRPQLPPGSVVPPATLEEPPSAEDGLPDAPDLLDDLDEFLRGQRGT